MTYRWMRYSMTTVSSGRSDSPETRLSAISGRRSVAAARSNLTPFVQFSLGRSGGKFESGDSGAWLMLRIPQVVSRLKTQPHFSVDTDPCLQP